MLFVYSSRCPPFPPSFPTRRSSDLTGDPTQALLLYFIMPVWFLAGFADYLCHRATDIAHTAGPKESVFHLLMFGEIAIPLLMRSEEHTSELQSLRHLVCRLLLEKKK